MAVEGERPDNAVNDTPSAPDRTQLELPPAYTRKPYTLWNLLSITFRRFYDDLGRNVLANLLWTGLLLGFVFAPVMLLVYFKASNLVVGVVLSVLLLLVAGPATAGLYSYCVALLRWEDPPAFQVWTGFCHYYWRSLGVTLILFLALGLLAANSYICIRYMLQANAMAATILLMLQFWAAFFLGMLHLYPLAFVVRQNAGPWTAIKRSVIVALARPWQSIGALILTILFLGLSLIFRLLPLFIFSGVLIAMMGSVAVLCMLEEYEE